MKFIKLYLVALVIFFAIDLLWLGVISKNLYKSQIGHLMTDQIRWGAAALFYSLYLFGLLFFAIIPSLKENNWNVALFNGALFGLICYATYDLTNLATLKGWPLKIVIYDMIWGTFISAATASITYKIGIYWKSFFS
jgi:uncharacterized membrane protein